MTFNLYVFACSKTFGAIFNFQDKPEVVQNFWNFFVVKYFWKIPALFDSLGQIMREDKKNFSNWTIVTKDTADQKWLKNWIFGTTLKNHNSKSIWDFLILIFLYAYSWFGLYSYLSKQKIQWPEIKSSNRNFLLPVDRALIPANSDSS